MRYRNFLRHTTVFLTLLSIIGVLVSCSKEININLTYAPINPLFNPSDIDSTSLLGGNTYYSNFLSSDGKSIFYQSVDGKSLMKSDYDGENPVVLSNRFPSFINVSDKMVFFIEGKTSGKIFKVGTDGKGETMILDANAKSLIVYKDYVFYIDTKDGFVYSAMQDGSKKTLLFDKITSHILLVKGSLYIQQSAISNGIYKLLIRDLSRSMTSFGAGSSTEAAIQSSAPSTVSSASSASPVSKSSSAANGSTSAAPTPVPTATPVPVLNPARSEIMFVELTNADSDMNSINIENNAYFFIDHSNNSSITSSQNKKLDVLLKSSILSPMIISEQYLYYINPGDQSRLYRLSLEDTSVREMVVNDRVDQFVVCGHSIYYRRENKSDIFLTPIKGGISDKIT